MWHTLEFSSEILDNFKKEIQRLQDEGIRLTRQSKLFEHGDGNQNNERFAQRFSCQEHGL